MFPPKEVVINHELPQLVHHEVKQILSRSRHQLLADGVLAGGHPDAGAGGVESDQDHTEVGSSKIKCQILS